MPGIPEPFGGIIPPLNTPLAEDFDLDVPSLQRLIGFLLDAGVHGLFVLGSTSETALLSDRQRATVIEVAVGTVAGQVPVLAGVIATSTAASLDHARVAQRAGVDGIVLTAPFYVEPNPAEVAAHFRAVRTAIDLPILAYDIPGAVQTKLARETVLALARDGVVIGIKDSSGDDGNLRRMIVEARPLTGFSIFTGSELLVDVALLMGARGAVPGLGNVDPAGYVRIFEAVRAGDLAAARIEQERLVRLFSIVDAATPGRMGFTASAIGGFKSALMLRGVIATNVVGRPLLRYDAEEVARVRRILVETGLL